MLRTYPAKRPRFPFAPEGERSIARAYLKAFGRARRLVYVEDQYLWSAAAAGALADALRRAPRLRVIVVVPRYPDRDGRLTGAVGHLARARCMRLLRRAGGDRVAVYDVENERGDPIYVHAKVCTVDDVWMTIGSDNLNVRSWTHDSEVSCAVIGTVRDTRRPDDPAGLGDGARQVARATRLRLACEHLGRDPADTDGLVDPDEAFATFAAAAGALPSAGTTRAARVPDRPGDSGVTAPSGCPPGCGYPRGSRCAGSSIPTAGPGHSVTPTRY